MDSRGGYTPNAGFHRVSWLHIHPPGFIYSRDVFYDYWRCRVAEMCMQQNANSNLGHLPLSESLIFEGAVSKIQRFHCRNFTNKIDHKTLSDVYVESRPPWPVKLAKRNVKTWFLPISGNILGLQHGRRLNQIWFWKNTYKYDMCGMLHYRKDEVCVARGNITNVRLDKSKATHL